MDLPESKLADSLRASGWQEKQPFVFRQEGSRKLRCLCVRCGNPAIADYMVTGELWQSTVPKKFWGSLVHIECLESMMDRPLVASDFPDVPLNGPILTGIKIGSRLPSEGQ